MKKTVFLLALSFFFSCQKEEIAVSKHAPGKVLSAQVPWLKITNGRYITILKQTQLWGKT